MKIFLQILVQFMKFLMNVYQIFSFYPLILIIQNHIWYYHYKQIKFLNRYSTHNVLISSSPMIPHQPQFHLILFVNRLLSLLFNQIQILSQISNSSVPFIFLILAFLIVLYLYHLSIIGRQKILIWIYFFLENEIFMIIYSKCQIILFKFQGDNLILNLIHFDLDLILVHFKIQILLFPILLNILYFLFSQKFYLKEVFIYFDLEQENLRELHLILE